MLDTVWIHHLSSSNVFQKSFFIFSQCIILCNDEYKVYVQIAMHKDF